MYVKISVAKGLSASDNIIFVHSRNTETVCLLERGSKLELNKRIELFSWEIGGTKFYEKDIDLLLSIHKKPTGIAYVYLEPFMEIEKYYSFIKKFSDAQIYQHLYTNGTLARSETLKALGEVGLNEIRFNLGASTCSDKVIENIGIAKNILKM